ncbi:bifunctional O-antigen ligase/aminoglycoside phosphotransferase family protein [Pseudomonas agarici]|uniref:bifunctional O-antigen ligase/aminoglycoside phosphotransferase family protein n=1 Tax=Pseudomonas agarici TaxID=46677 RepID=UPI0015A1C93D|nr:bifunctional O-antigen ligase/aminoglycoside phosphotransferase family protein [Pseudomonas agarici]NWB90899.1 O-antigen ligase family protein [Pseudomonas agarici]
MQSKRLTYALNRTFDFLCLWVLPAGYLMLLCGMFVLSGRSALTSLYLSLFAIPTLLLLCLRPTEVTTLLREPLIIGFAAFGLWACLSLLWSPPEQPDYGMMKIPLQTLMLFAGCALLLQYRGEALKVVMFSAAIIALGATTVYLARFAHGYTPGERMVGAGAFDNPLLSSHVFGFFCIYWLSTCITTQRLQTLYLSVPALVVMFLAIIATGSRTPLVALTLAIVWLSITHWNRRTLILVCSLLLTAAVVLLAIPELLGARGNSYRFELWNLSLQHIGEHPWIGHGYDSKLYLDIGVDFLLREPHSFALGVLYYVGLVGLLPWLFMLAWGLFSSFRQRHQPLFVLASTMLVYGIGAGLTEGGGILSRPREHWFLLWIPLALIASLHIARRSDNLLMLRPKRLKPEAFARQCHNAEIIEADGLGPKVLRLEDKTFLKLFRPRRWYTSGNFNPYSQRFAVNSARLLALRIPAPRVLALYNLPDGSDAVHYQPLPGQTLRQTLQSLDASLRQALMQRFGRFMAQLHERGVYFRSLHLGNVLLMDDGEFGLIDVADMRILPSALSHELRVRNLRHMQRYPQDRSWLFEEHFEQLLNGYQTLASDKAIDNMRRHIEAQQLSLQKS